MLSTDELDHPAATIETRLCIQSLPYCRMSSKTRGIAEYGLREREEEALALSHSAQEISPMYGAKVCGDIIEGRRISCADSIDTFIRVLV